MKTTKRIFAVLMCISMIISVIPAISVSAITYSGTCGDNLTWTLDTDTGVLTISGTGNMTNYSRYKSPFHSIRTKITSVIINEGVTSIGSDAFDTCYGTSITIPSTVTSIGSYAFYEAAFKSVNIPNSVTTIGEGAFYKCGNLASVYISDITAWCSISFSDYASNPLRYGRNLYINGESAEDIIIPDDVTNIGNYTFYNCNNIKSVTIPDSVTSIGDGAFRDCTSLTSITIPDSVTSIGEYTFYNCSNIKSVTIPDSVTSIGDYAFFDCTSLTSITISDNVTSIGSYAFSECSNLASVYITDIAAWCSISFSGVTSNPLYYGGSLYINGVSAEEMIIPDDVTSIGDYAFYNCSNIKSVTIPDSMISIGYSAFHDCTSLTSITISDSVTSIGGSAFYECSNLANVYITDIAAWCSISFSYDTSNPLYYGGSLYINGVSAEEMIIPDDVTSIGNYAFYNCSNIKSVPIPDNVTSIGNYAFYGCTSLSSVTIPDSVTSMGTGVFSACDNLTSAGPVGSGCNIEFAWTKSIPSHAFYGCASLTSVTIPDSVTSMGNGSVFYACDNLTSAGPVGSGCNIEFAWMKSIPANAFYYCSSLTSITIPNSVTSIGNYAFSYCTALTSAYYLGSETAWKKVSKGSYNTSLTSVLRYAVSDIEIAKLDHTTEMYTTDYDSLEVFDDCSFSVEVIVPADTELLTFSTSDWKCPITETSSILQSSAIDFDEVTVSGPSALENDENYNIYYVSVTGELKEKGDFTLTFTSPNNAVSSVDISIERQYKILTDNWRWDHVEFINSSADGAQPYYLSKSIFSRVFTDSFMNQAIYNREKTIITSEGEHPGECFGLAASSALFYEDLPKLELLNSEAEYAYEVQIEEIHNNLNNSLGLELHEFIEAVNVSQWTVTLQTQQSNHRNKYQDLINAVSKFESTGNNPVIIGLHSNEVGHAVLGYKVETLSDESRVYIYDPNYPKDAERYISFPLNSKGVPTGWSFVLSDITIVPIVWSSDDSTASITYVDDLTYIYEALAATSPQEPEVANLFTLKSDKFNIIDKHGNSVFWSNIVSNSIYSSDEYIQGIIPITLFHDTTESDSSTNEALFYYEGGSTLTFENDSDAESVELSVYDDYSGITITSDGHSVVEIGETDDVFDVTVTPSESGGSVTITYTTEDSVIEVTGTTDDSVSLQADSGESEITISGFTLASVTTEYGGITDTYNLNSKGETVISANSSKYAWSIDSYANGIVTLTAPSDAEGDYYVTIAQYDDDGILIDCEIAVLTAESEKTLYQITTEKALSTGKIKIMLWDKNLIPLSEAYEY